MGVITIDYETLTRVVVLLFALVGFMRGWIAEGITMVILVGLVGLLYYPDAMAPIIQALNKLIMAITGILKGGGTAGATATAAGGVTDIIPLDNPYKLLMWLLVILLILSYMGGRFAMGDRKLSALSRILGGVAGAINGFIAISLFKEYMLRYIEKLPLPASGTAGVAAAAQAVTTPGSAVVVSVQNLPQGPFLGSVGPTVLILGGVALVVVLVSQFVHGKGGKK